MNGTRFIAMLERIERDIAVLELEKTHDQFLLPLTLLPAGAKEGLVLEFSVTSRADLTAQRQSRVADLQKKLADRS